MRSKLRGNGFTLYGLLEEIPSLTAARHFWRKDLPSYDLVVISNLWSQWRQVQELLLSVEPKKLAILDGQDTPAIFPYALHLRNQPWAYLLQTSKMLYFKRELMGMGLGYRLEYLLPYALRKNMPPPRNVKPLAFSIPEENILAVESVGRTNEFPTHIVDEEIAKHALSSFYSSTGSDRQAFSSEEEYYGDLQQSRFGVTTKRRGWDCLRHYELAANGCVLCFRDLDHKPSTCAPHGLDTTNCIIYHSYEELQARISSMSLGEYSTLKSNSATWIRKNTTKVRAQEFLAQCGFQGII